jgi:hypothetical protein
MGAGLNCLLSPVRRAQRQATCPIADAALKVKLLVCSAAQAIQTALGGHDGAVVA